MVRKRKLKKYDDIITDYIDENLLPTGKFKVNKDSHAYNEESRSSQLNKKYKDAGVKAALLLQFEPFFSLIINFGIYLGFCCVILDLCMALSAHRNIEVTLSQSATMYYFDVIYLLDIITMIYYKKSRHKDIEYLHKIRKNYILCLELLSIVPIELIYLINAVDSTSRMVCILRMRYAIRLFRLLYTHLNEHKVQKTLLRDIICYLAVTMTFVLICTTIELILKCRHYANKKRTFDCDTIDTKFLLKEMFCMWGKITGVVSDIDSASLNINNAFCPVILLTFIFFILILGQVTFNFVQINMVFFHFTAFKQHVMKFLNKQRSKKDQEFSDIDHILRPTLKKYITMLYMRHVRATSMSHKENILPEILNKEISCDIYWDALKHVRLFRDLPPDFLRYISTLVVHTFYTDGEPIYTLSENMSKMILILNGVIKVHSEVNGETPIISFSSGTCLGASTLVFTRTSTTYVTCHNYCETVELHRSDFVTVCQKYPQLYQTIVKVVFDRCTSTRRFLRVSKYQRDEGIVDENKELLSIRYLKHKLRVLLSKDLEKVNTQQIWSYDDQRIVENQERSVFCGAHLNKYVICEDQELDPDINFTHKGLFFKFRPDAPVLHAWRCAIVVVSLSAGITIPYCASYMKFEVLPTVYTLYITSVTLFWALDIVLQLVTGVVTTDTTLMVFLDIFKYRMASPNFQLDILACVPFEVLYFMYEGNISTNWIVLLQLNRVIKLYRFTSMCNEHHTTSTTRIVYLKYFKYIVIFCYWIFFVSAVLNYTVKGGIGRNNKKMTAMRRLEIALVVSMEFISGVEILYGHLGINDSYVDYAPLVIFQMFVICIKMYIISDIASAEALHKIRYSMFVSFCNSLRSMVRCFELDKESETRLWDHVMIQWKDNQAERILKIKPFKNLSSRLHEILKYSAFGNNLHQMDLLKELPDDIIRMLCTRIDVRVIPAMDVITYFGDNATEMYLLLKGYCARLDHHGNVDKVMEPGSSFSVLEMLQNFRSTCTIMAMTDCKLVVFERNKFISDMVKYPDFLDDIMESLWTTVTRDHLEGIIKQGEKDKVNLLVMKRRNRSSFHRYKFFAKPNTPDWCLYMNAFPRRLHFLRYIMLPLTIRKSGKFLFYYEITRCTFACATCFIGSFPSLTNCVHCNIRYVFIFLDTIAWFDIFVRHYISYYNSQNLEETHPFRTIINYWTHGFLVDLLASFPFDRMINAKRIATNRLPLNIYMINRCLQLYRPFFLKDHIKNNLSNFIFMSCILDFIQVLIIVFLVWHFISLFDSYTCSVTTNAIYVYFYEDLSRLVVKCSLFLNVGYKPVSMVSAPPIGIFLILVGHLYIAVTMAKAIGFSLFCNVDITTYQGKMRSLVKFLAYRRLDKHLRAEIINHFEYIWLKRRGMLVQDSIQTMNTAFKEDIMYAVYGSAVQQSTVFPNAPKAFIQNFLLAVQHKTFLKKAIIYRVNDIHGFIYFIFKGHVEVLGPDYNRLLVLPVGSFFGNLDRCPLSRQTLTMVAKGHCELLSIESIKFHQILMNYRVQRFQFKERISTHVDYISGGCTSMHLLKLGSQESVQISRRYTSRHTKYAKIIRAVTAVNSSAIFLEYWTMCMSILTFIFFVLEIYQKVTFDTRLVIMFVLYASDVLVIVKIYAQFHIAVEDEYGNIVTNRNKIALNYRHSGLGFYYDIFTVVPVELFLIFFLEAKQRRIVWTLCRLNRLIRVAHVLRHLYNLSLRLNVNVYLIRTCLALMFMFTIQQITIIPLVQNELLQNEKNLLARYALVNAYSLQIICMVIVPSEILIGPTWYKIFLVLKMAYLRICFLYFTSICTTALFVAHNSNFTYSRFTDRLIIFVKRLKISKPLFERVQSYIRLFWLFHKGIQFPEFLEDAPYYLREAVLNRKQPVLMQCHRDLLRQIAARLRTRMFFPGDFITFRGDIDDCMYFVHDGEVVELSEDSLNEETIHKTLTKGEMFGLEQGLLRRKGHDFSYKATQYTVILVLRRSTFVHLLDFFPASKLLIMNSIGVPYSRKTI